MGTEASVLDAVRAELRHRPSAAFAGIVVLAVFLAAVLAPWLAPYPPDAIDLARRLEPPSLAHWAGTDEVGRDLWSRILWGARPSLAVGFGVVLLGASLGLLIGSYSGYKGGAVDSAISRIVDMLLAMPAMVVALALTAALGPGLQNVTLALGLLSVPTYIRLARGQALSLRERDYVRASRALGAGTFHQLRRNIVPNVLPTLVVFMTFHLGGAILAASALSFIGLGAQPPTAEWGALISAGRGYALEHWWYAIFPGVVIVLTVVSFNVLGDALRDAIDPRSAR